MLARFSFRFVLFSFSNLDGSFRLHTYVNNYVGTSIIIFNCEMGNRLCDDLLFTYYRTAATLLPCQNNILLASVSGG